MDIISLLEILADGGFYSGVVLGKRLNMSRTSIWKMIPRIEELGIPVECVKGKGYRIPGGLDLLPRSSADLISEENMLHLAHFERLLSVDSTNSYASEVLADVKPRQGDYVLILAEHQSGGRGRRGRVWQSPFGQNLYFSIGFNYLGDISVLSGLSLAIGLGVADALDRLGISGVGVKWPNDVMVKGKKIAGVLIELTGELSAGCQVIVGVGLNVRMDEQLIDQPWTSLKKEGADISRTIITRMVINGVLKSMEDFLANGFASFHKQWVKYDWLYGKEVTLSVGERHGKVLGVSDRGELLIESPVGQLSINAGEVSVRVSNSTV